MAASFEFLANFEEWRQECRQTPTKMDHCPFPGDRGSFERRTAHAELLKTLTAFKETSGKAKDGEQNVGKDAPREEEKEEPKTERFKMEKDKMRAIAARAAEKISEKAGAAAEKIKSQPSPDEE